ncbi:MAG TPA: WecB/TagA/CpsF family glycosyltransferase [bacterium]|nr:WecB/TagA/CpsF family glycosyltransferase [bacterium]
MKITFVTLAEALGMIGEWLSSHERKQHYIVTPNPEILVQSRKDVQLRDTLNSADLAIADGVGLRLACGLQRGCPRLTGVDLMQALCAQAAVRKWRIFLLGGSEGVAAQLKDLLEQQYPGIRIAGAFAGDAQPTGDAETHTQLATVGGMIDLLFVAYGAPRQEAWISRNLPRLLQVRVAMAVGGSFDYLTGRIRRAPVWMRRFGLEWLFRLGSEPWRWRRMLRLPYFVWLLILDKLSRRRISRGEADENRY